MPFVKGQSGNPGGKKKALGLSRHVRASQGLETWAKLLQIREGWSSSERPSQVQTVKRFPLMWSHP
jgi:hypothetical protein